MTARASDKRSKLLWAYPLGRILATASVLLLWLLFAGVDPDGIPPPWTVASVLYRDRVDYVYDALITSSEAVRGYLIGIAISLLMIAGALTPRFRSLVNGAAAAAASVPLVAFAPLVQLTFSGDGAKTVFAALSVIFTNVLIATSAVHEVDRPLIDTVRAFGGSRAGEVLHVRFWSALPPLAAALKIGVPAAFLGSVVAEFFGGDGGLGVAMLSATQRVDVAEQWTAALVVAAISWTGYLMIDATARFAIPWVRESPVTTLAVHDAPAPLTVMLLGPVLLLAGWWLFSIRALPLFAASPSDALSRAVHFNSHIDMVTIDAIRTTLYDAVIGYGVGVGAALIVGAVSSVNRSVGITIAGFAIAIRSLPVIVLVPLMLPFVGRTAGGVGISSIVTFAPTVVIVTAALAYVPNATLDVARSYGSGRRTAFLHVRLPHAAPMIMGAAKAAVTSAITGALLGEWLATGHGLGFGLVRSQFEFDYTYVATVAFLLSVLSMWVVAAMDLFEQARFRGFRSRVG
jgi:sulfonate transport system permease protein